MVIGVLVNVILNEVSSSTDGISLYIALTFIVYGPSRLGLSAMISILGKLYIAISSDRGKPVATSVTSVKIYGHVEPSGISA